MTTKDADEEIEQFSNRKGSALQCCLAFACTIFVLIIETYGNLYILQ